MSSAFSLVQLLSLWCALSRSGPSGCVEAGGRSEVPQRLNRTRHAATDAHTLTLTLTRVESNCNQCPVNKAKTAEETGGLMEQLFLRSVAFFATLSEGRCWALMTPRTRLWG